MRPVEVECGLGRSSSTSRNASLPCGRSTSLTARSSGSMPSPTRTSSPTWARWATPDPSCAVPVDTSAAPLSRSGGRTMGMPRANGNHASHRDRAPSHLGRTATVRRELRRIGLRHAGLLRFLRMVAPGVGAGVVRSSRRGCASDDQRSGPRRAPDSRGFLPECWEARGAGSAWSANGGSQHGRFGWSGGEGIDCFVYPDGTIGILLTQVELGERMWPMVAEFQARTLAW